MKAYGLESITPATVRATVADYKRKGMSDQAIEDLFKEALKVKYIGIDIYYEAMRAIYEN